MVSGTDTVAVVQAEGPRPVIGLFAGRTGVNCCDHPVRQIQSVEGIPPILGDHLPVTRGCREPVSRDALMSGQRHGTAC